MDAMVMKSTINSQDVIDPRIPAVVVGMVLKSDQGILPAGCIMSKSALGKGIPYQAYADLDMTGDVDGNNKAYTYAGGGFDGELAPRSVVVTHGDQELVDDGHGHLYGDGSGTVNYITGAVAATFTAAPAAESGAPVVAAVSLPAGILTRAADTSLNDDDEPKEDVGAVLVHGSVTKSMVTINGAASAAADYTRLQAINIFALD